MELKNEFGWSLSREAMFDTCRRRYYFHYYLSWGGWKSNASPLKREAFKLKRLVSLSLWRGQLVHYIVAKILQSIRKRGILPDKDRVKNYTSEHFEKQLRFSAEKRYLSEPKKKDGKLNVHWLALLDHEYERPIPEKRIEQTLEETMSAIDGFYSSPIIDILRSTETDEWIIEDIDLGSFSQHFIHEGVKVYVKTDFCFRGEFGTFNIVDWKTYSRTNRDTAEEDPSSGKTEIQLGIYSYYASKVLGEPADMIRLFEVNLLDGGEVNEFRVDETSIPVFEGYIRNGISRLSSVLVDEDTERNEPLSAEHFPKTESPTCRMCNFYRICKDESSGLFLP